MKRLAKRYPAVVSVYHRGRSLLHRARMGNPVGGSESVDASHLVWIFGSGRSGSTWLRSIMGELPDHTVWEEPMVGRLFGHFYENARTGNLRSPDFIMGNPVREGWKRSVRNFVLDGARYSHPGITESDYVVVKEPNGSIGAPVLLEALPESRMVLLVRDPRDVVSSALDGARSGGWLDEWRRAGTTERGGLADRRPEAFVRNDARRYLQSVGNAARAFDGHTAPKTLVRYEDLLDDTPGTVRRIYEELGIGVDDRLLNDAVEKHSWSNIPDSEKGEGKFYRKASSGGWREDLTQKQARIVEELTAPLIRRFYGD